MRIFLAGASGVIGTRLVPLLVREGHVVAGMTRSSEKRVLLRSLGAEPVLCDVFDPEGLQRAVVAFRPDLVMHQLTDLPDDLESLAELAAANARMRREGTANLLAAARTAHVSRFVAQSVAWTPAGPSAAATAELERRVLDTGGVVLRYGRFYGAGTYYEDLLPDPPRIQIDDAALRTVELLDAAAGVYEVVDP